ncbi:MAG: TIGR00730 family Rossman fold protein [Alphaproteobacteria bacterium]|nr:TIGR00730 family Rossman fold protein [Alphaproteobacteria bacterium]
MPRHSPPKAYKNPDFVNSGDARAMRIMAEYLEPRKRLREAGVEDTIVFYGSARIPSRKDALARLKNLREQPVLNEPETAAAIKVAERALDMSVYYEASRDLAFRLTQWSCELGGNGGGQHQRFSIVTGGGAGIMEAANRGAMEAGGETIGMNISLPDEQFPNEFISEELAFEFHYFFMRKFWLVYMAKAAVVMPGGFGTLDEFTEILTLVQTGKMRRKLPILLFGSEYWKKVIALDAMADFGVIDQSDLDLFFVTDCVDDAFDWLKAQLLEWAVDHPGGGLTTDVENVEGR